MSMNIQNQSWWSYIYAIFGGQSMNAKHPGPDIAY